MHASRHKYYPNSNSTFQLQIFLISGDILPNPGPTKGPCWRCEKPCKSNQRAIQCDGCDLWCHATCAYVSSDDYNRISSSNNAGYCNACCFNMLSDSFFSESTGDSPNNLTATIFDISEPDVIVDYKTSIAAHYKFNQQLTTSLKFSRLLIKTSTVFKIKWMK